MVRMGDRPAGKARDAHGQQRRGSPKLLTKLNKVCVQSSDTHSGRQGKGGHNMGRWDIRDQDTNARTGEGRNGRAQGVPVASNGGKSNIVAMQQGA